MGTHRNENNSCPPAKARSYAEHAVHGTEYVRWPAWAGCLAVLPPSACTLLPEHGRLGKVLDFLATTKNISVINILLLLNLKHSSYWEGSELSPSRNQDS